MSINVQDVRGVATSASLGAAFLVSGCVSGPMLPKNIHINETDRDSCVIKKYDSFQRGKLLAILVPFLIPDRSSWNNTEISEECLARNVAEKLLDGTHSEARVIAVAIYDQLSPAEKELIDEKLKAKGTTMEELAVNLPRIVATSVIENCAIMRFQLPDDKTHRTIVAQKCKSADPAPSTVPAPS